MPETWRGSGKVLVIDDDAGVLRIARLLLERLGFAVETAESGPAGVERLRQGAAGFRCVLLDLTMPGWDGLQTLERLREVDPAVRVILTSGFSAADALGAGQAVQHAGFLQKPYQLATLIEVLRSALGE